ncbi:hypothetical protein QR680_010966 [Steinernema hermaphroditum]|uniref:Uncharacterized protein n=1 Tax=Steinernema hermaphroditum TaxID=289476 RepID=A0AA39IRV4_9BILA|nr:hypothetical protein QR680_010966 [Steinernema hermaphroditum]
MLELFSFLHTPAGSMPNEYFLYVVFYGSALVLFILPGLVLTFKFIQDCRRHRQQELFYEQIHRDSRSISIVIEPAKKELFETL